jgi:two-component system, OmpR family, sensor histidine kinase KdpD
MHCRLSVPPKAAYVLKSAAILLATLGCSLLASQMGVNKESILMIFLLGTVLVHVVTPGYWYGLTTAAIHVAAYSYLYAVPLESFSVSRPGDVMLLVAYFITSFLCGSITNRLTIQREISENNARTAKQMQQVTEGFLQVTGEKAIVMQGIRYLKEHAGLECAVNLASGMAYPQAASPAGTFYAVPITGVSKSLGVLNAYPAGHITFQQELLLKAVAAQMAIALDRDSFYIEQEKIRLAMERERLRSTLLRAVAHDLRSPLTVLVGASGLLSGSIQALTDPEKSKLAKDINEEVIWLTDLVENILSMTQIQESRLFLRRQEEVVDDAVNEAVKHVAPLLQGRKLSVTLPEEVVTAPMDIKLVAQVIINLLDNAARHTPPDSAISLNVIPTEKEVIFEVCDDGPGIDPAIQDTLFEGFTQKSIKVQDGQRGLGLGLAICQAVVSAHGGTIKAENRSEGGSRFVFTLPRGV